MIGETVTHYRIVEQLGAGGMGVVYKAEDLRLKRPVALKFLPPELTRDDGAKERFVQEAQTASALDHPNICIIHEIDETPDGRMFLAMAYYEGETLRRRIERGPLGLDEALDVAGQIARGVAAAHEVGIIHRDIKPGNIMMTRRGEAKLLDFGIAKLLGQTGVTRTGSVVGTVAYMAPEQITGAGADQRSDVWALGLVLYEMLTGRLPFTGNSEVSRMHAILHEQPRPLRELRSDLPVELDRLVGQMLQKDPPARPASMAAFLERLNGIRPSGSGAAAVSTGSSRAPLARTAILVPAAIAVAVALLAIWAVGRSTNERRARRETIPEVKRLIDQDHYVEAIALASKVEPVLRDDPALADLWPQMSLPFSLKTDPPGADVYVRDSGLHTGWEHLGRTPIENVRVPLGVLRWKIAKDGFTTQEFIDPASPMPLAAGIMSPNIALTPEGSLPPGMVRVPAGSASLTLTGYDFNQTVPLAEYLIDKYEVTNKAFKEFVDAGGYQDRKYWKQPFVKDGRPLSWEDATAQFRDQTGRPGPSTWEVGTYPKGQEDYPVGGVSWYEAAAYAEFRGRSLPTVYHWLRAAGVQLAAAITPLGNSAGKGPAPVGRSPAVTPFGLYDAAGNVKEWCLNELTPGSTRYILGGSWTDPDYSFIFPDARSPFDRSVTNGFRTVKYVKPEAPPARALLPILPPTRSYVDAKPVSDEVFGVFKNLYAYDPAPLDAVIERTDDTSSTLWRKEKVSFTTAYGKDRLTAHLFVPKNATPPYQTVLHWPGSSAIRSGSSDQMQIDVFDFLIASGRAVLHPIYLGTFERRDGHESSWPDTSRGYRDWTMKQVNDARRSIDYLRSRADVKPDAIGYYGFSWGARMGSVVLAIDPRLRAAVFLSGGFAPADAPPEVDPFNFAPRVSVPVLMVNGEIDFIFPVEQSQKPLFERLGSPPGQKRHIIFHGGHGIIFEQRSQVIREMLDWFDRYLGQVK